MATIAKLGVDLVANSARFRKDLDKASRDAKKFFGQINRQSVKTTKFLAGMGAAAAGAFTISALKQSAEYASALSNIRAKTFASRKEIRGLSDDLRDAAKQTKFTATQTAEAAGFLAQAGFGIEKIRKSIRATLDIAAATGTSVQVTADIVSNILTSQGIAVLKLAGTADMLALAGAKSNTSLTQMGEAFKLGGPAARGFNLSIAQSAGLIGTLANSGIQATLAGTALRGAFTAIARGGGAFDTALAGSTESLTRQEKVLRKLGVQTKNQDGSIRNLIDVLNELTAASATTSDFINIFGSRAGSSLSTLAENGTESLNALIVRLRDAEGAAQKMADIQMDNLAGDTLLLASQWEEIKLIFTEGGLGNLARSFVQGMTDGMQKLEPFVKSISKHIDEFAIVLAVVSGAAAIGAVISLGNAFAFLAIKMALMPILGLWSMVGAIWAMVPAFGALLVAMGPIIATVIIVGGTLATLGFIFWQFRKTISNALSGVAKFFFDVLWLPIDNIVSWISTKFFDFFAWILSASANMADKLGIDGMAEKLRSAADALTSYGVNSGQIMTDVVLSVGEGISDMTDLAGIGIQSLWEDAKNGAIKAKNEFLSILDFSNTNVSRSSPDDLEEVEVGAQMAKDGLGRNQIEDAKTIADGVREAWGTFFKYFQSQTTELGGRTAESWDRIVRWSARGSKKLAAIHKAFSLATAIRDSAVAIMKAWSSAPFPANLPAVGLATVAGAIQVATIRGQAHDGIDNVPNTGTYLLESGERVVDKRLNRDLSTYLAKSGNDNRTSNQSSNATINFNVEGTDPEGLENTLQNSRGQFEQMLRDVYAENALPDPLSA